MTTWPKVPLGAILSRSPVTTAIDPEKTYHEITVKLWGKGVIERGQISGAGIAGSRRFLARTGQLILSRIDARNGALGIVPPSLDGAVVTNDFPLFNLDTTKILPAYLGWLVKTKDFVDLCRHASEGTTNRVRLQEARFMALETPLPPLLEQRRLVAKIVTIATNLHQAREIRQASFQELGAVLSHHELEIWPNTNSSIIRPLVTVTTYLARGRQAEQGDSDHFLIKSQHVQMGHYVPTALTLAPHVSVKVHPDGMVCPNDILIACSAAGCLGRVARYEDVSGRKASTDTHVAIARPDPKVVLPEYLYAYLRGAQGQIQLRSRERGDWQREKVGFRLTELNLNDLRQVPVPVPSPTEQKKIVEHLDKVRAQISSVSRLHKETEAELTALLPAVLDRAFKGEL